MARYHYWQFIVNQEGQPINNVEVSIFKAGTSELVRVYRSEFGDDSIVVAPQVYSNNAGYFEFWLGDSSEEFGYEIGTKIKIQWYKENIAAGSIDWIDVFPGFEEVNELDSSSNMKNKLVSNNLAYQWMSHINHQDVDITDDVIFKSVTLTQTPTDDEHAVRKDYVDNKIIKWEIISDDATLESNKGYFVDVSTYPVTLMVPVSASLGNQINVVDYTINAGTNSITLSGDGIDVEGASSYTISGDGEAVQFVYTDVTYGWKKIN